MPRVLVIDDDPIIRHLIVAALEGAGYQVLEASSGREGAMLFRHCPTDVVITDLVMPDDSLGMVLAMRQAHPALPFVLISGLGLNTPLSREVAEALQARRV